MTGPTVQPDLVEIIIRFRRHRIAIAADAKQMYRQVIVNPEDCNYQRIVWRTNPSEPIKHFKLGIANFDENKKNGIRNSHLSIFGIRSNFEIFLNFFLINTNTKKNLFKII